jgi:hypothetical protein
MSVNIKYFLITAFILVVILSPAKIYAHCDSYNGPVVKAAKTALESDNINYVLVWVQKEDEPVISSMFQKIMNIRNINDEVKEIADNYFFETVVRIHRQGEGVAYTGIKTADYKPEEGIEAADIAIETSSADKILAHVDQKYHHEITELFNELQAKKNYKTDDTEKGREYVASYVHFIHYIEELYSGGGPEQHHHH